MYAMPDPASTTVRNYEDEQPAWERRGVTLLLIEAFLRAHDVTEEMKTFEVCQKIVK